MCHRCLGSLPSGGNILDFFISLLILQNIESKSQLVKKLNIKLVTRSSRDSAHCFFCLFFLLFLLTWRFFRFDSVWTGLKIGMLHRNCYKGKLHGRLTWYWGQTFMLCYHWDTFFRRNCYFFPLPFCLLFTVSQILQQEQWVRCGRCFSVSTVHIVHFTRIIMSCHEGGKHMALTDWEIALSLIKRFKVC